MGRVTRHMFKRCKRFTKQNRQKNRSGYSLLRVSRREEREGEKGKFVMIESKSLNLRSRTTTFVVLKIVKKLVQLKGL